MLLLTIWPIFALICLGFLLSRKGFPSGEFWGAAERLNYFLLFPALLVGSLAKAPVHQPGIVQFAGVSVLTVLVAAGVLTLWRLVRPMPAPRFGPVVQAVVRFNTYVGLSVLAVISGSEGIERAAVYLAVAVPVVNVLSILALAEAGAARRPLTLAKSMLRNPLILACLMGFLLAFTGIGLPYGAEGLMRLMGQASLPLGLLCIGAALKPEALKGDLSGLLVTGALRLLAMPLLAFGIARAFGLGEVETLVLVLFSAVPTAPSAYVLTRQLGGDASFMAGIVTAQTIAAALSLPLVLSFFGRF